jgi:hypothetical protein
LASGTGTRTRPWAGIGRTRRCITGRRTGRRSAAARCRRSNGLADAPESRETEANEGSEGNRGTEGDRDEAGRQGASRGGRARPPVLRAEPAIDAAVVSGLDAARTTRREAGHASGGREIDLHLRHRGIVRGRKPPPKPRPDEEQAQIELRQLEIDAELLPIDLQLLRIELQLLPIHLELPELDREQPEIDWQLLELVLRRAVIDVG